MDRDVPDVRHTDGDVEQDDRAQPWVVDTFQLDVRHDPVDRELHHAHQHGGDPQPDHLGEQDRQQVDDIREKCEEDLLEKTDKHRVVDMARENINNSIQTLAGVVLKSDEYEKYSDYTINLYNTY